MDLLKVLNGDFPRLIDEWQEVPALWDAVRMTVDPSTERGQFLLTGSSSKINGVIGLITGFSSTTEKK